MVMLERGPSNDTATLSMPDSLPIPCLMVAELAWDGELMLLASDGSFISMPNLLPGSVFTRID